MGEDLLHHVIVENNLIEKVKNVNCNAINRYVYRSLLNEFTNKSSKFYKLYIKPSVSNVKIDDTNSKGYDTIPIHTILLKLETEGHKLEVKVFKECYLLNVSEFEFSRRSNIDYRVIVKMCKFVKEEIRKRYVIELD